jgi:hypothetical protein
VGVGPVDPALGPYRANEADAARAHIYGLGWFVQQHRGYKILWRYEDGGVVLAARKKGTENNFQGGLIPVYRPNAKPE